MTTKMEIINTLVEISPVIAIAVMGSLISAFRVQKGYVTDPGLLLFLINAVDMTIWSATATIMLTTFINQIAAANDRLPMPRSAQLFLTLMLTSLTHAGRKKIMAKSIHTVVKMYSGGMGAFGQLLKSASDKAMNVQKEIDEDNIAPGSVDEDDFV